LEDDALALVEAYLAARDAHDYRRARTFLADRGFVYESPISRFDSADAFLDYIALTSGIILAVETRKVFVDGSDVCHLLNYRVQISEKFAATVVHWATVQGGRIVRIETVFDASEYRKLFPGRDAPTAAVV
jgi:hypothetical protein